MTLHFDLNWAGWTLLVLYLILIVCEPFWFGDERKPYGPTGYIETLVGFALLLIALGVVR